MADLAERLQELGFSAYEAKAYVALRCRFEGTLAGLEDSLARVATESSPEFVWNIRQYDLVLGRAAELVRTAAREVAVFGWAQECARLAEEFDLAVNRWVNLLGVVCGDIRGLPQFLRHGFEQEVLEEQGSKLFVVVRDAEEALIGGIDAEATPGEVLVWRPGCEEEAGDDGLLFLFIGDERGRSIRLPEPGLLYPARKALVNADVCQALSGAREESVPGHNPPGGGRYYMQRLYSASPARGTALNRHCFSAHHPTGLETLPICQRNR